MYKRLFYHIALLILITMMVSVLFMGCAGTEIKPKIQQTSQEERDKNDDDTGSENEKAAGSNESTSIKDSNDSTKIDTNSKDASDKDDNNTDSSNTGADNKKAAGSSSVLGKEGKKDIKVKALYLTGWTAGSKDKIDHFAELANKTEINSYVIDIKDDDGLVGYETNIPAVKDIGAWTKKYDVDYVLKKFHENNIHVIGRIVCFKDPILSSKRTDLAIKDINGGLWKEKNSDGKMITWLNPFNKESWPYMIDIAKEAVQKGFDEIQFDYVRFPSGKKKTMDFGNSDKKKYEAINEFLAYARKELPDVVLSADIFGIVCEGQGDSEDIGQHLELIGKDVEYISPMLYPSHYALGQTVNGIKFSKPDLEPYGVVYNSLTKTKNRLSKVDGYRADVRPYLQDFTASWIGKGNFIQYGPEQVRQQIKAVYDAGYEEWILWSARNNYSEAAFLKNQ